MKKPNLFIVGAPKSGTTSLYNYLKQHPDIFMCTHREPNFFCKDLTNTATTDKVKTWYNSWYYKDPAPTFDAYMEYFAGWENEKIGCDPSSGRSLYSKVAAKEIHDFNPDAKILIMIREPISFLRSLHSHFVSHLSENIHDFGRALAAEEERKQGKNLPKGNMCPPLLYYSEVTKFSEQIQRYLDVFGRENVKLMLVDDMKQDVAALYRGILEFVGVDPTFQPEFARHNENKKLRSKHLKVLTAFPYFWKPIKKVVPSNLYATLRGTMLKVEPRTPLNPELKLKLMKQFKPEVEKLANVLQRDVVSMWGYDKV